MPTYESPHRLSICDLLANLVAETRNEIIHKHVSRSSILNMNLRKIKKNPLFVIIILTYGCSIPTDFYIQNLTNKIKTIKIKYNFSLTENLKLNSNETYSFHYIDGVVNPKYFNKKIKIESLKKSIVSDAVIEIQLRPKSTTRIAKTQNYRWLNWVIKNIEIDNEKIDIKEIGSESKRIKNDYLFLIK